MTEVKIENGKYTLRLQNGNLNIYRHEELWLFDPPAAKMLIAMMYEIEDSRELIKECFNRLNGTSTVLENNPLLDKIEKHQKVYK